VDTAWLRSIVALAAAVSLVALGALEMITARVQFDDVLSDGLSIGGGRPAPWPDVLDAQGDLADREPSLPAGIGPADGGGPVQPRMVTADELQPG